MRSEELGMKKRFLFSLLIAGALFVSCNTHPEETVELKWQEATPLHEIYSEFFLVGNIISPSDLNNTTRFDILKRHYNVVTAENHMKPDQIAPAGNPGSVSAQWNYRFNDADKIIKAASDANLKVHGHTLIWHTNQSPTWLAAGGEPYLNKFVTEVVDHFKGKLISWDVVNEAFRDGLAADDVNRGCEACLRGYDNPDGSPWYKSMGPDYIEKAFLAARAADPGARLY
jgi:endo-1,4-beta-xylanase